MRLPWGVVEDSQQDSDSEQTEVEKRAQNEEDKYNAKVKQAWDDEITEGDKFLVLTIDEEDFNPNDFIAHGLTEGYEPMTVDYSSNNYGHWYTILFRKSS